MIPDDKLIELARTKMIEALWREVNALQADIDYFRAAHVVENKV